MATVTEVRGFPTAAAGAEVLGEVVAWSLPAGAEVRHRHLREALEAAGLDPAVARRFLPRNAFARAAQRLAARRIIRRLDEDDQFLKFQFTSEQKSDGELHYHKEAILTLDKATGAIACPESPDLEQQARDAVDDAMDRRTVGDVTAIVQRLFSDRSRPDLDLIPLRQQGGCYFVRASAREFVDGVNRFLDALHGSMLRLPLAAGYGTGERAVAVSVADRIAGLIAELDERVTAFDPDPARQTPQGQKAAAERVKVIRHKIESYREYLLDERERLEAALEDSKAALRAKLAGVTVAEIRGEELAATAG